MPKMLASKHFLYKTQFSYLCCVYTLGQILQAFTADSIGSIMQPGVISIVINNAAVGIVTSLFLRNLNSILKTFASALELLFTAILCWLIFGIPVDLFTVLAIFIVSAATYLYAQNPVVNKARTDVEVKRSGEVNGVQSSGSSSPGHQNKTVQSV